MTRVLVVDNYDSFVYTLNGYLQELGATTDVIRNDAVAADALPEYLANYDAVLLSPGPGGPADAGISIEAVRGALRPPGPGAPGDAGRSVEPGRVALATETPLLGVCLGPQAIAEAFGAVVT